MKKTQNSKLKTQNKSAGFTLIELLVVIAIIAILVAFISANFLGARQRAKDVKKKAELTQLKNALRIFYNDYNVYPNSAGVTMTNDFNGCGSAEPPAASCLETCSGQFAAGGTGCTNMYMKQVPPATDYEWSYQERNSADDFCMWTVLENPSDPDIAKSQVKCSGVCSGVVDSTDYVLCAD